MGNNFISDFLNKCDILLEDETISKYEIIKCLCKYYQAADFNRFRGIILHTGSVCFDAVSYVFSVLSNLALAEFDQLDFASSLQKGDMVLHTNSRGKQTAYVFEKIDVMQGFEDKKYMFLVGKKDPASMLMLPPAKWNEVRPYYGNRSFSTGKGIRKRNPDRRKFYEQVLNIESDKIPNEINSYSVMVMTKERADYLSKNISFMFDGTILPILDLVPVSYFTEEDEYQYRGNLSKTEAVIKITSKVSVARKLMSNRNGNKCMGMMICDDDILRRSDSEIPELFSRRRLQSLVVSTSVNTRITKKYIEEYPEAKVFACTKDFLLAHWEPQDSNGKFITEMSTQTDILIDREVTTYFAENGISWEEYKSFKRNMQIIKHDDLNNDLKDNFIIQSYSLFNLMLSAAFPLKSFDQLSEQGIIGVASTNNRIIDIERSCEEFPRHLKNSANIILGILKSVREREYEESGKERELWKFLSKNHSRNILLIAPKAYYKTVIKEIGLTRYMIATGSLSIVTPSKIDSHQNFDTVIALGNYKNEKFNIFSCVYSKEISVFLYECEKRNFRVTKLEYGDYIRSINARSYIPIETDEVDIYDNDNTEDFEQDNIEMKEIDQEIEEYISKISVQTYLSTLNRYSSTYGKAGNIQSDIVAMIDFESGEHALLTKNYKAYVLDEILGNVKEVNVENISEGDLLIFTENNEDTHDIVDVLLNLKIESEKASSQISSSYALSKEWRNELVKYRNTNHYSSAEVAYKMKQIGAEVATMTIVNWMDEDSHLVGPQNVESIRQIGLLVGNEEMSIHPQNYHDACRIIRRERRSILKEIGKMILRNYSGDEQNSLLEGMDIDISALSVVLRVESVHSIDNRVASYLTNHPINL